jgi:type III secretion system YscQ/HrcQ family protein
VSRKVLLAGLLEPLAARLEKSLGIALQVESVEPVAEWGGDGAPRFTIADVAQLPGIGVIGTVEAEKEQDWAFWQHLFGAWPLRSDSEQPLPDLVKLRCILGRTRMPLAELRGIPLGSLLLIEERTAGEGAVGVVLATEGQQQRVFRGQAKGSRIEIVSEEPQRKPAAEPPGMREAQLQVAAAGTHDARLQNIEELSVSVEFDLGEQTAALHVLKQVRPGFVFKLTQPVEQASVRIQANGQTIGYGQLIAVGEVLGVRVTAFLQDGS